MPRLGIHSLALTPLWDPNNADALLAPVVEHRVGVVETPLLDPDNYDAVNTRAAAKRLDIEIVCSLGLPESLDVATHTRDAIDYLSNALLVARDASSAVLSGVTYGTIGKTSGSPPTSQEIDAICRLFEQVAKKAKSLNMKVGLEPCNRYETHLLNTAKQTVDVIERVGADNLFVHLDTYHMNIEEAGIKQGFVDAGSYLGYVHLSESQRGVPGQGTVDWQETFGALKSVEFNGTMTLESFVYLAPEIAAGLAVWRPVAEIPTDVINIGLPFLIDQASKAGILID